MRNWPKNAQIKANESLLPFENIKNGSFFWHAVWKGITMNPRLQKFAYIPS